MIRSSKSKKAIEDTQKELERQYVRIVALQCAAQIYEGREHINIIMGTTRSNGPIALAKEFEIYLNGNIL